MQNKFIETVISIPSEIYPSAKVLININHICCLEEDESDKTTWIIMDSSKSYNLLHSLECYQAFRNQILEISEE